VRGPNQSEDQEDAFVITGRHGKQGEKIRESSDLSGKWTQESVCS
jgi:hypothetical protein